MSTLSIYLFGSPRVEKNGTTLRVNRRKNMALLCYLAVTNEAHSRETLATLLWPEAKPGAARANLRRGLALLTKTVGRDHFAINREAIGLQPDADTWVDVAHFEQLLAHQLDLTNDNRPPPALPQLDHLSQAVTLASAEFMAGFSLADSLEFDDWQRLQTESYRQKQMAALQHLVEGYSQHHNFADVLTYSHQWLTLDPLCEPAYRHLMMANAHLGNHAEALRHYRRYERLLHDTFATEPTAETIALFEAIRAKQLPPHNHERKLNRAHQQRHQAASPPHNLQPNITAFIGRSDELATISTYLANPDCRLISLVGGGGIGKTRLSLQAARHLIDHEAGGFQDGIYFIALAAVKQAHLLPATLAQVIGFTFYEGVEPKQQILDYFREKSFLLILDNFEHLLDGVALVQELLLAAPHLKILVTSRETLNLQGEWRIPIEGLPFATTETSAETITEFQATQLFIACARREQPDFDAEAEQPHLVRICQMLEGLPLGIELATSWLSRLSCREIAEKLAEDHDLLTTTQHNVPARHKNIQTVIEQSWQLLSTEEQQLFIKLAVFQGGCTRPAIEHIAQATLTTLAALVDKSLLRLSPAGRYDMHPLIQHFAQQKLQASPEIDAQIQKAHTHYYLAQLTVSNSSQNLRQGRISPELLADIENIRLAWDEAVAQKQIDLISHTLESFYQLYWTRSWFAEGLDKFKTLTARLQNEATTAQTEPILAKSLIRQGAFWQMMGNFDEALTTLEAGLTIAQKLTLTSDIALALTFKGKAIQEQGNEADAQTLAKQALAISRQINDPRMIAQCYFDLAQIAMGSLADYPDVQHYVEQSLAASRQIGDQNIIAHCLHFTGYIAAISGDLTTAETYCQESLAIFAETGDRYGTAMAYGGLGLAAEGLGPAKFAEAKAYYEKRFAFCQEIGMRFHMTSSLYMLGNISNQMGEYQAALDYLHAGLKIARELQIPMKLTGLLAVLSNAHIELGHYNEARNCLKEALDAPHIPWIVAYFLEAIYVSTDPRLKVAQQADAEWRVAAIERLSFVCHHPSTWYTVRMRAKARLEELAVAMPPAQLKLAQSTGEAFDLWKVVDRLLAELQS